MREPEVPSPCVKVCVLNAAQVCTGCGRHINEIATWSGAIRERRLEICAQAAQRLTVIIAANPNQLPPKKYERKN